MRIEPTPPRRHRITKGELIYILSFVVIVVMLIFRSAFSGLAGKTDHPVRAPHGSATTGPFAFLSVMPDGRPVTYDRCRPIYYVVNPDGMPSGGRAMIRDAIRTISTATGLTFIEDGLTQERPNPAGRRLYQPQRYGERWAPVLIAWTDQADYPMLRGNTVGFGASWSIAPNGPESERYVTGQVVLDREGFPRVLADDDSYAEARAIVTHELGHVVGLDHVTDPAELMARDNVGQTELGPGDRQGLAELGKGQCWPDH